MSVTKALVEQSFRDMRTAFAGANVLLRYQGNTYTGIKASIETSEEPGAIAGLEGADGAVRLLVSEMKKVVLEAGNVVEIKEPPDDAFTERRIATPRYDQTGATVRIDYGARN